MKEWPGSVFISEVKCSKTLYDDIERHGGVAIMWKTGHSLIKAKMKEADAQLAGEMSGHIFFKDRYFGFDDGIYSSCRLLEVLARARKRIPELLDACPGHLRRPKYGSSVRTRSSSRLLKRPNRNSREKPEDNRYRRRADNFPGRLGSCAGVQYAARSRPAL